MNDIVNVGMNTELLFQEAIKQGAGVDALERLMAMRRELKEEFAKESFFRSLSKFQFECPEIAKKKEVKNKQKTEVRYSYAPLDFIVKTAKPHLKNNGFSYTIETIQRKDSVTAVCSLHHTDGYTQTTNFEIPIDPEAYMNASQKVASALTYAKRYAFCNATGILTTDTDDDAEALTRDATYNQVLELQELASNEKMPEKQQEFILNAIAEGLSEGYAKKLIARAKAKV